MSSRVEEALEKALCNAEDRDANYWIRTALQRLIAEYNGPDESSSDNN